EKGFALRCERISISAFLQQFEAHERVHDRAQTSNGGSSFSAHFLDIFCAARQGVEDLVRRRRTDDQRWRIGKTKLHQTLGVTGSSIFAMEISDGRLKHR